MTLVPAAQLLGLRLSDKWNVIKKLEPDEKSTGGNFSFGYIVETDEGRRGFLKALDFSRALNERDPARALQRLTESFNFERDILNLCRERSLSRIVTAIHDGSVIVPNQLGIPVVQFLIFELADGDIRHQLDTLKEANVLWTLRALHSIASGLHQLHSVGLAHQDLKPSNVLVFSKENSLKLADLGRAAAKGRTPPHDVFCVQGDPDYAPPELLYGEPGSDWNSRRIGCDSFHLGSIAAFLFAGINMTALIFERLEQDFWPDRWGGSFGEVLPHVRAAFEEVMAELTPRIPEVCRSDLSLIIRQLCEPDPQKRGHPRNRIGTPNSNAHSLERYVSTLDRLATRTEINLRSQKASQPS